VRDLINVHNAGAEVESHRINIQLFEQKLRELGGTSESTLALCTWEDIQSCGVPKLVSKEIAEVFRDVRTTGKQLLMEEKEGEGAYFSEKRVNRMTYDQLLAAYNPLEDNAVAKKLKELSGGKPFIVLVNGIANVPESVKLLQELKRGYTPRDLVIIDNKPTRLYSVGERPNDLVDENPLYPGRALRPDGTCDQMNRSWAGVDLSVRQLLRVALVNTREVNGGKMNVQLAHDLLDVALTDDAGTKFASRFPKAAVELSEMAEAGNAPTLKVALSKAKSTGGREQEPFGA
jgi:hypothetical protein